VDDQSTGRVGKLVLFDDQFPVDVLEVLFGDRLTVGFKRGTFQFPWSLSTSEPPATVSRKKSAGSDCMRKPPSYWMLEREKYSRRWCDGVK